MNRQKLNNFAIRTGIVAGLLEIACLGIMVGAKAQEVFGRDQGYPICIQEPTKLEFNPDTRFSYSLQNGIYSLRVENGVKN